MKHRESLIAFGPFLAACLAALAFCIVYAYLFVFGTLLGLNVSSLDGNGPSWPFSVMYVSGVTFAITVPIGIVWALVYILLIRRKPEADGDRRSRRGASPAESGEGMPVDGMR